MEQEMYNLEAKVSLFKALIEASAKPVNAEKTAKDVIKTLELFEGPCDAQPSDTENTG